MKRSLIYNAIHQRLCYTLLVTFLGSVFSFPLGNSAIHVIDDGVDELATELYIMRILIIAVLVLMGGFFAGLCIYMYLFFFY